MIQRRQFIGSLAAFCAVSGTAQRLTFGFTSSVADLNWNCQVIKPPARNEFRRAPVVTGLSLQPGGKGLLAIADDDHHVSLYDTHQQKFVGHLIQHRDWVRTVHFSPDGNQLVTAGNDREVCLWNVARFSKPVARFRQPGAVIEVTFSDDGQRLATVGFDSWLRIYDLRTRREVNQLRCPCSDMHAISFSADSRLLAAAGRCGTICVWDTITGTEKFRYKVHRQRIRSLQFTSENKIVSAGDDQRIHLSDPSQSRVISSLPRQSSQVYAVQQLNDNLLATAGSDNKIHLWNLSTMQPVGFLSGHTGTVTSLDYQAGQLVSGSYDTQVRIWSQGQQAAARPPRHTELGQGWNAKLKQGTRLD